jgi:hypothetical protein
MTIDAVSEMRCHSAVVTFKVLALKFLISMFTNTIKGKSPLPTPLLNSQWDFY